MRNNLRLAVFSIVIGLLACTAGAGTTTDLSNFSFNTGDAPAGSSIAIPPANSGAGANGLTFVFTPVVGGTLEGMLDEETASTEDLAIAANVMQGFQDAANRWSALVTDNVTVNITVNYGAIGHAILGGASSERQTSTYSQYRTALTNDQTTANDTTATANLPSGSSFSVYINRTANNPAGVGSATPYLDDNGGANNTTIRMTQANAKALGLREADNTASDASITFTDFSDFEAPYDYLGWDFDSTNGVGSSDIDFVGVATHEIGHVLGFISGVDILDNNSPNGETYYADDVFSYVAPLDMFRSSDDSIAAGADIDWTADERAKFFSINGGDDEIALFSTGRTHGDGSQASHWKDNLGLGLMDPTTSNGEIPVITALDAMAFDVIGWDVVPEPATMSLLAFGGIALLKRRKR